MKKFGMFVCVTALFCATSVFGAEGRPYFSVSAGLFLPEDSTLTDNVGDQAEASFDTGYVMSGAGGYAFDNGLRIEGELSYRQADMDQIKVPGVGQGKVNSDVWALTGLANVFYDIKTGTPVTPYVGGGVGISSVNIERGTSSNGTLLWTKDDDTVFAYQAAVGVGLAAGKNVIVDIGYRYFGTQDVQFDLSEAEFSSHNIMVGARFMF